MFDDQCLRIFKSQTDQGIGRTFARAAAMKAQFLHIEQTDLLLVVEAMKYGFVV
ncbi:hypothetical protein D3C84_1288740 [compost metagenome]